MPRDEHHLPKAERALSDMPPMRLLRSWNARFVVPALANRAARAEMAGRRWMEETASQRRRVASRVAAQPVSALLAVAGVAYLVGATRGGRR